MGRLGMAQAGSCSGLQAGSRTGPASALAAHSSFLPFLLPFFFFLPWSTTTVPGGGDSCGLPPVATATGILREKGGLVCTCGGDLVPGARQGEVGDLAARRAKARLRAPVRASVRSARMAWPRRHASLVRAMAACTSRPVVSSAGQKGGGSRRRGGSFPAKRGPSLARSRQSRAGLRLSGRAREALAFQAHDSTTVTRCACGGPGACATAGRVHVCGQSAHGVACVCTRGATRRGPGQDVIRERGQPWRRKAWPGCAAAS